MATRHRFEEDSHRVIAFNHGDRVGRFHDGHVCSHAALAQMSVTSAGPISEILIDLRIDGGQLRRIASLLIFCGADDQGR
jgi:hypothetical protein